MPMRSVLHYDTREFDIVLFSTDTIEQSIAHEFEALPLKVGICVDCKSTTNRKKCVPRDVSTMLPMINGSYEEIQLVTGSAQLLVNLSEHTLLSTVKIIEACISTNTGYIDNCTDTKIILAIKKIFNRQWSIKIVQGCAGIPLLIDLAVYHIGRDRSICSLTCTIHPGRTPKEMWKNMSNSGWILHNWRHLGDIRHNSALGSYEIPIGGFIEDLLMRSRKIFSKKGATFAITRVFTGVPTISMLGIYLLIVMITSIRRLFTWKRDHEKYADVKMNLSLVGSTAEDKDIVRMEVNVDYTMSDLTATCLAQTASSIIENPDKMCGVLTPAVLLQRTGIIERLMYKKIEFNHFFE